MKVMQSQLLLQRRWNKQGLIKRTVVTVADDTDAAIMLLFHWKEIMVM